MTAYEVKNGFWFQVDELTIEIENTFDGLSDVSISINEMEFDFNFSARELRKLAQLCNNIAEKIEQTEHLGYDAKP